MASFLIFIKNRKACGGQAFFQF